MDIYLVNSGRCDLLDPRQAVAQTRCTATIAMARLPMLRKKSRPCPGGPDMAWAWLPATTMAMVFPIFYVTQYGRSILFIATMGTGPFTDVTGKAGVAASRLGFQRGCGLITTTTEGWDLVRVQVRGFHQAEASRLVTPPNIPALAGVNE